MHDSISPDIYNKYDVIYTTCLCYLKFYMVKYMCVREKFIYIYTNLYIYKFKFIYSVISSFGNYILV